MCVLTTRKFIGPFLVFVNYEISDHPLRVIDAKLLEKLFRSEHDFQGTSRLYINSLSTSRYPSHLALNYTASIHDKQQKRSHRSRTFFEGNSLVPAR